MSQQKSQEHNCDVLNTNEQRKERFYLSNRHSNQSALIKIGPNLQRTELQRTESGLLQHGGVQKRHVKEKL